MLNDLFEDCNEAELELIFNSIFSKYGGIKKYDNDLEKDFFLEALFSINFALDDIRLNKPHFPDFYVNFINSSKLNAVATLYEGVGFIGVNVGTYMILHKIFHHILSHDSIFPDFGKSSHIKPWINLDFPEILDYEVYSDQLDANDSNAPLDSVRSEFAQFLALLAVTNIAIHEYGHITDGHCGYLNSKKAEAVTFSEYEVNINESFNSFLDSQTCEMDADSFSVFFGIQHLVTIINHERYPSTFYDMELDYNNFLEMWMFATNTYWRLQNNLFFDIQNLLTKKHPPALIRHKITLGVLLTYFFEFADFEFKKGVILKSVENVKNAFELISGHKYISRENEESILEILYEHEKLIMCNWNTFRENLIPFAYANISPRNDFCDKIKK